MATSKANSGSAPKKKISIKSTESKPKATKLPAAKKQAAAKKPPKTAEVQQVVHHPNSVLTPIDSSRKTAGSAEEQMALNLAQAEGLNKLAEQKNLTGQATKAGAKKVAIQETAKTPEPNPIPEEKIHIVSADGKSEKIKAESIASDTTKTKELKKTAESQLSIESNNIQGDPENLMELTQNEIDNSLLMECAWEVCNQVGGIFTVIQTKVPATKTKWGNNYLLLGPYFANQTSAIFEYDHDLYNEEKMKNNQDPVQEVVRKMHSMGYDVHYGTWLIDGRPKAILFNPQSLLPKIHEHKYIFWEHHNISLPGGEPLIDKVVSFGFMVYEFIRLLSISKNNHKQLIAHFHEWMAGIPIPELRRNNVNTKIVFTTHATMLGRYLAMNDPQFYDHLPFYNWEKEANHFNIGHIVKIERAASHGAHIFSTVSDITAKECKYLLGRKPEAILPNGLNIKRFDVMHEFQQLHKQSKAAINEFVMGHFFHNYTFDLDKTLYFFTSGRFEYYNKGFDLTLEALARLNWKMKSGGIDKTVVMFFITKNPFHTINPRVLESRAKLEGIRRNCDDILKVLSDRLFDGMLTHDDVNDLPDLNVLVDDYLALRLRRNIGSWRDKNMPSIVTHDLVDEHKDPIMNFLKTAQLLNYREDRVKVVYHPDFVSTSNPLFRLEYLQFVRGCHLGIFPSYYEPWGYTPLECCASGLPSITTDLSGFGSYVMTHVEDYDEKGLWIIKRQDRPADEVAEEMANKMLDFVKLERRERIGLRNRIDENSPMFGWRQLRKYYDSAYANVLRL